MKKLRLTEVAVPSNFNTILIGAGINFPYFICRKLEIQGG